MNWKEFKKNIEEQGMTDETEILYIDTDMFEPTVVIEDGKAHIY